MMPPLSRIRLTLQAKKTKEGGSEGRIQEGKKRKEKWEVEGKEVQTEQKGGKASIPGFTANYIT